MSRATPQNSQFLQNETAFKEDVTIATSYGATVPMRHCPEWLRRVNFQGTITEEQRIMSNCNVWEVIWVDKKHPSFCQIKNSLKSITAATFPYLRIRVLHLCRHRSLDKSSLETHQQGESLTELLYASSNTHFY